MEELNKLVDDVGDYISALKTHVDLIDDWTKESGENLFQKAKEKDLLIFEDRKHGDIGKIVRDQMGGFMILNLGQI